MHLDVPQKITGEVKQEWIDNLLKFLSENEEDWYHESGHYRTIVPNLTECNTLSLRHTHRCGGTGKEWNNQHLDIRATENRPLHDKYLPYIKPFLDKIKEIYPDGTEYSYILTRLPPGGKIGGHMDNNLLPRACHRIHIPIQTHPNVEYLIADYTDEESNQGNGKITSYYWSPGKIYEFSNERWHAVHNNSNIHRIHLIFNVYNFNERFKYIDKEFEHDKDEYFRIVNEAVDYFTYITNGIDRK